MNKRFGLILLMVVSIVYFVIKKYDSIIDISNLDELNARKIDSAFKESISSRKISNEGRTFLTSIEGRDAINKIRNQLTPDQREITVSVFDRLLHEASVNNATWSRKVISNEEAKLIYSSK